MASCSPRRQHPAGADDVEELSRARKGAIFYYYGFPKNTVNDWLVAEHYKRFKSPPDFFTAGGMTAASAVVTALTKAG